MYTMQIGSHDWQNWLADVHNNKFLYDPGYQPYWATRKRTLDDPAGYWYASAITGLGSQIKIGRNADLTEQRLQEVWYKTSRFVGQRAEQ